MNGRGIGRGGENVVRGNGVDSSYEESGGKERDVNELMRGIEYLEEEGFDKGLIDIMDREGE